MTHAPTPPQPPDSSPTRSSATHSPPLARSLGVWQSTALNIANMVGIGPFITIPAFLATMGGPQALVGWIAAAILVVCDGLVWSELGAALPGSGGTYHYLREVFGHRGWRRIIPFLFVWQFFVSGTLEIASGYIGGAGFLTYAIPELKPPDIASHPDGSHTNEPHTNGSNSGEASTADSASASTSLTSRLANKLNWIAVAAVLAVTLLLCRRIESLGALAVVFCTGTIVTVLVVIVSGLWHFDASLLTFPPNAFRLDGEFAIGLGGAMTIAIYDYLGYYNICHVGEEVRDPGRTIPRSILLSVVIVAAIYLTMNLSIIAVVPWQQAMQSKNVAAEMMAKLFGHEAAVVLTGLVLWTALAGLFAMTLGYSRILYAAARNGDFFRPFAVLHPTGRYPIVSLWAIGGLTAVFCFFDLEVVIKAAVTVRVLIQFIGQNVALHLLRRTRPDVRMPFRMWLYPLPSLIALGGWLFILGTAGPFYLLASLAVIASGCGFFFYFNLWQDRPAQG